MLDQELAAKHRTVLERLRALEGVVVAFSGGVDSTLLLRLARDALGDRCVGVTAVSPSLSRRERDACVRLAREMGVSHLMVESRELEREGFAENSTRRCYFCKSELFDHCFETSRRLGLPHVVYGATADDLGDHRPGMAAARERGAVAPLLEAGLGKSEIRSLSRRLRLPTWDKPAMACLSSRFPYGTRISPERLEQVERAEDALRSEGFHDVRVRYHGDVARIEVGGGEWHRLADPALRERIHRGVREAGFTFVALDLLGFRSGRLNRDRSRPEDPVLP